MESVKARVHPLVLELVDRPNPQVGLEGKFSYQHSMAVGLVDGAAFPAQYTDARVKDPVVIGVRDRIEASIDGCFGEDSAEVTLTLEEGRSYTERVEHATGAPKNPLSDRQLDEKFRSLVGDVLPKSRVERLLSTLWDLDQVGNVGEVIEQMRDQGYDWREHDRCAGRGRGGSAPSGAARRLGRSVRGPNPPSPRRLLSRP